ncbi:MAG: hypothetical protein B7Z45_05630 [Azorhizobium sp. 12-66-6]|nr:MAG: hypothetical protein B7Z45_05630 [Azorhizobium sp. 12-66-6]
MSRSHSLLSRLRLAALAATAAVVLAGCNGGAGDVSARSQQPLSPKTLALIEEKGMTPSSPILVRVFKQEAELEVWKQTTTGTFALLKSYPICRWSGELGPKVKVGDRQAPEGFYTITPGQMNPNSNYYLSFNLGFPNAFDRSYGRTGEFLMVHGDCSSAGCYSMTDEQMAEIYALARDSFAGGQRSFQVQALPFRMTPTNMAKHRNNPNMPFWKNLKEGADHFEVTQREPKVNVCERRYVFDAEAGPGRGFDAAGACPTYTVPFAIANAVKAKERADDIKVAELARSTPVAPVRTGADGGMHAVFLAKFKPQTPSASSDGQVVAAAPLPGTIPAHARPPKFTDETSVADVGGPATAAPVAAAADSRVAAVPATRTGAPGANLTAPTSGQSVSSQQTASLLPPHCRLRRLRILRTLIALRGVPGRNGPGFGACIRDAR